jgi:hypothetical protein
MLSHLLRAAPKTKGIEVVATTTFYSTAITSALTMTKPTGTATGNLMVAWLTKSGGSDTYAQPTGWTELIDIGTLNNSFMLAYKVANGSEPADYTWTTTGTSFNNKAGNIITFANATYDSSAGASSNTTTTAPSRTASFNNSWLLLIGRSLVGSATITFSGATTIVSDSDANNPSSVVQYIAVNAGSTGTTAGTYSTSTNPISTSLVIYNS